MNASDCVAWSRVDDGSWHARLPLGAEGTEDGIFLHVWKGDGGWAYCVEAKTDGPISASASMCGDAISKAAACTVAETLVSRVVRAHGSMLAAKSVRVRRCSKCRKVGHDHRSCPRVLARREAWKEKVLRARLAEGEVLP